VEIGGLVRWFLKAPVLFYRAGLGWMLGRRFLLLIHVGRRTGAPHRVVLEVVQHDPDRREAIVVSGVGRGSDWYRNLKSRPARLVVIGRDRFAPVHRELDEDEAFRVMSGYEHRNRWITPLVRRALSWLVGWSYDGSPAARRRLVHQLPLIGLRPAAPGQAAW
jgi:deazaflavin-dependent oxidoreductase (nitroreductase family)